MSAAQHDGHVLITMTHAVSMVCKIEDRTPIPDRKILLSDPEFHRWEMLAWVCLASRRERL